MFAVQPQFDNLPCHTYYKTKSKFVSKYPILWGKRPCWSKAQPLCLRKVIFCRNIFADCDQKIVTGYLLNSSEACILSRKYYPKQVLFLLVLACPGNTNCIFSGEICEKLQRFACLVAILSMYICTCMYIHVVFTNEKSKMASSVLNITVYFLSLLLELPT